MQSHDRLTAVDLRDLSEVEHAALRQEAIRLGISFSEYLSRLVADKSARLVNRPADPAPTAAQTLDRTR